MADIHPIHQLPRNSWSGEGLLSLSGNVIGAGIACQLMRVFIGERAEKYLARSALARYEERITRRGAWVIFLL